MNAPQQPGQLPQAGFGGVLDVTFATDDSLLQDEIATRCGLAAEAPLVASGVILAPTVRWFATPDDQELESVRACLDKQDLVRRAVAPR